MNRRNINFRPKQSTSPIDKLNHRVAANNQRIWAAHRQSDIEKMNQIEEENRTFKENCIVETF